MKNLAQSHTLCFYSREEGELIEIREKAEGSKSAAETLGRQIAKERGIRFVRSFTEEA